MARSLRRQFGIRLKTIRLERKLTQEQFAELVGISVDFLSLIERGINAPSFEVLEMIGGKLRAGAGFVRFPKAGEVTQSSLFIIMLSVYDAPTRTVPWLWPPSSTGR
jgi:transcriptional regulator with XRE-family HTH domain